MSFFEFLKTSIDEVNKRSKKDNIMNDTLKKYSGKRVVFNMVGKTTYAVTISSKGLSLVTPVVSNQEDMYVEMENRIAEQFVNHELNPLEITSMVLVGKIKLRNIGTNEIDLVKKVSRGF